MISSEKGEAKYFVLVSDKLSPEGIQVFKEAPGIEVEVRTGLTPEELKACIGNYHGLAVRSATKVSAEVIEAAKNLKVIGRAGTGVDNVDVEAATKKKIIVMNTPQGNRIATAEHTIALMFALCRQIPQADSSMRAGKWEKSRFMGVELYGKTLGVIGLGNVGSAVAERGKVLGMKVIGCDPHLPKERTRALAVPLFPLDELLPQADFVTIHTPLNPQTYGMVGKKELEMTKPGVRVINCARGGLIDEAALVSALVKGKVAGAGLDVFENEPLPPDSPFLKLENVVLTPHLGAATAEAQLNVAVEVANLIVNYLLKGEIVSAVNFPA